jgi:catechol 2,3-dioxygenase-like lactoylglutathione lyase family enzyme
MTSPTQPGLPNAPSEQSAESEQSPPAQPPCPFDRRREDVGNLVEFGHVNIRVPDQQTALLFYVVGLGLTRDPYLTTGVDNAWINVGTSQFHLPVGPAQVLRGCVHLVLPDLDALAERLRSVAPRLSGTRFAFEADATHVDVTCPWGNRIRVHAPDAARFGAMALGMPQVQLDVPPGTAAGIARFYTALFASAAHTGRDADGAFARVPIGLGESLVFRETAAAIEAYDGHHIQVTVADFSGVHARLRAAGLVTEESDASQYRFERIVDLETGALLTTLEHEVRSMRHPMYARPLLNRDPAITTRHYAAGHEAVRTRLPPTARR